MTYQKLNESQRKFLSPIIKEMDRLAEGEGFTTNFSRGNLHHFRHLLYSWIKAEGLRGVFRISLESAVALRIVKRESVLPEFKIEKDTQTSPIQEYVLAHLLDAPDEDFVTAEFKAKDFTLGEAGEGLDFWREVTGKGE